jgi:hypothetical protein
MKIFNSNLKTGKYKLITFSSFDNKTPKSAIYHTNVVLAILDKHAIICLDSITDLKERENVKNNLSEGREIVNISYKEMEEMCGNMI